MNKLSEFVKDLIKKGILVSGVSIRNEELAYDINGFAKSGTGTLFIEDGKIKLETRYKRIDTIESLSDLVDVAYEWDYDGSQVFGKMRNGRTIQIDAGGDGDFTHHLVSVTIVK